MNAATAGGGARLLADGNRVPVADATVTKIARQTGRTPAQVLLRWCLQHGLIVIAKSTHRARIRQNAQIFDFALSADEMAELDAPGATIEPGHFAAGDRRGMTGRTTQCP